MPSSTAVSFAEVQEQIYDHVESIKDKCSSMLQRPLPLKQLDTIRKDLDHHLDCLIRSVSDLQAASASEVNKWRQRCLKQKQKLKTYSMQDTMRQITMMYDKNASQWNGFMDDL